MKYLWITGFLVLCIALFAFNLTATGDKGAVQTEEIHKVMGQIFQQHLQDKTMTDAIIRDSIRNYIEQFDPAHTYLLESEAAPFLALSDEKVHQILNDYNNNNYTIFNDMDAVFQQAITRARQLREELIKEKAMLFQAPITLKKTASYPKSVVELKNNIQLQLMEYVAIQKRRYGDSYVMKHPVQILETFDARTNQHEDHYLYVDSLGDPLSGQAKESLFSMHVLKAMARSLDVSTDVLSPSEAQEMMIRLEKGYPGIGITLQQRAKGLYITRLTEKGPAARSGEIKPNDKLVVVNGQPVEGLSVEEVMDLLRGVEGSSVNLVLERKTNEEHRYVDKKLDVILQREFIPLQEGRVESSYETVGNGIIGKLKLNSFYRGENGVSSENDMRQAISELDAKGNLRGLIIDLRENTGGFLTQAVKVAGLFITNGVIVTAKYTNGNEIIFRDVENHEAFDGPLVILTSKATASAAEIVAQALQDYGVALVVGDERTYGKGTIQNQTVTDNSGSNYFKVTIGKYYTVSGKTPNHQGVKADIVVPSQFSRYNFGNEYVMNENDRIAPSFNDNLKGVPNENMNWFLRYYVPSLQKKTEKWTVLLPTLRKNSEFRLNKNKDFQLFLRQSGESHVAKKEESEEEGEEANEKNYGQEDLQMAEAVNIVRDMIMLQNRYEEQQTAQIQVKRK